MEAMKIKETKLYSFNELSDEAQDRVIRNLSEQADCEFTLEECMDSLKAVAKACGLSLRNWSIGPYNRHNFATVDSDLGGNKALAEFLRVLISAGYERPKRFAEMKFPGVCGFTGVCFDDDICEEIWGALMEGETLGKAFDRAADEIGRICEREMEYQASREGIMEYLDTTAEIYTEEGEEF